MTQWPAECHVVPSASRALFEEQDVGPAQTGQLVEDADPGDAATDDDDLGPIPHHGA